MYIAGSSPLPASVVRVSAMSLTLSSAELKQTAAAVRVLTSPFDHGDVDGWRVAVNRQLAALLGADSTGFMLPVRDGLPMFSAEHDPAQLARYTEYPPPPATQGVPIWQRLLDVPVGTLDCFYGDDVGRYLNSAYYNEYAGANGAHDTLAMTVPLDGAGPMGMASLQFWHARPRGRRFGEREVELLRLLYPAFEAGVASWAAAERGAPCAAHLQRRFGLTRRQADVARLLAERKTNPEIGELLFISSHTARHHVQAVLRQLGLNDRRDVAHRLRTRG